MPMSANLLVPQINIFGVCMHACVLSYTVRVLCVLSVLWEWRCWGFWSLWWSFLSSRKWVSCIVLPGSRGLGRDWACPTQRHTNTPSHTLAIKLLNMDYEPKRVKKVSSYYTVRQNQLEMFLRMSKRCHFWAVYVCFLYSMSHVFFEPDHVINVFTFIYCTSCLCMCVDVQYSTVQCDWQLFFNPICLFTPFYLSWFVCEIPGLPFVDLYERLENVFEWHRPR